MSQRFRAIQRILGVIIVMSSMSKLPPALLALAWGEDGTPGTGGERTLNATDVIVATGSRVKSLPGLEPAFFHPACQLFGDGLAGFVGGSLTRIEQVHGATRQRRQLCDAPTHGTRADDADLLDAVHRPRYSAVRLSRKAPTPSVKSDVCAQWRKAAASRWWCVCQNPHVHWMAWAKC